MNRRTPKGGDESSDCKTRQPIAARRGVAVLVVLLLISFTLALSYAAVRSQYTGLMIHQNAQRRGSARQAAMVGMTMAIKKMHQESWAGVDSVLAGTLTDTEGYAVSFTTGDPSLDESDPDYDDLPYRVTVLSTGYAADPDHPARKSEHRIRAVMRLVPRNLDAEPTDWPTMQTYTVFQAKEDDVKIDIPCRMEGPVRLQKKLIIAEHYPDDWQAWLRYLGDLNAMRLAGQPDYRPFDGPVHLPFSKQDWGQLYALMNKLSVPAVDRPKQEAASDWTKPESLATYQLYDGGTVYAIPPVGDTLENVTLEPDPLTNPLGLRYRDGNVTIRDNVTIRGTLFCKGDVKIEGENVHLLAVDMPALYGSDGPVRLPAVTCKNFRVTRTGRGSVTGLVAVFDYFEIQKGPETAEFGVTGRLVTDKLGIQEREPWNEVDWKEAYEEFESQLDAFEGPVEPYFPNWMAKQGRDPKPRVTIKPDPEPIRYHWHYPGNRIYVAHPDDVKKKIRLRWDLLEWTENP